MSRGYDIELFWLQIHSPPAPLIHSMSSLLISLFHEMQVFPRAHELLVSMIFDFSQDRTLRANQGNEKGHIPAHAQVLNVSMVFGIYLEVLFSHRRFNSK